MGTAIEEPFAGWRTEIPIWISPLAASGRDWRSGAREAISETPSFRPAMPWGWVIWAVRNYLRLDLAWRNRLRLERRDLQVLRDLPHGAGFILASNHADETDFKACLDRARLQNDLAALKRVAEMGSWRPHYVDLDPSQERLAEMVLKLDARHSTTSAYSSTSPGPARLPSPVVRRYRVRSHRTESRCVPLHVQPGLEIRSRGSGP